ncbi:hypothetical protein DFH08DRAFT_1052386 [Mycena albidolilacea]|uniref:Uncharacterized protein n=1 Tax=Mycena albidolilacea TaxID=1033008 RepID=A0AAD7ACX4_9AGAR|nr:hypothetical protein DFH08DRAFT_1052386 [Mycena albidolilacea]
MLALSVYSAIVFPNPTEDTHKSPFNSRIITSVRRNFSMPRRRDPVPAGPMYSTPAERNPYAPPRFRYDTAAARPTVEQIAMGLHLSRTPHLRGTPKYPAPASHPQPAQKPVPLPPPPARSSMKKPGVQPSVVLHGSTSSTTDVTSTAPSTPHSSDRSSASLRVRMSRFLPLPNRANPSTPDSSAVSSPRTSTSELHQPRKKAVRFSTLEEED